MSVPAAAESPWRDAAVANSTIFETSWFAPGGRLNERQLERPLLGYVQTKMCVDRKSERFLTISPGPPSSVEKGWQRRATWVTISFASPRGQAMKLSRGAVDPQRGKQAGSVLRLVADQLLGLRPQRFQVGASMRGGLAKFVQEPDGVLVTLPCNSGLSQLILSHG